MTYSESIQAKVDYLGTLAKWYHCIELPGGIVTPGWVGISPSWDATRKVRASIDYKDKRVLDLGSRDGMWAFEAEKLGASTVVATDIGDDGFREHILFLKQILNSKIAPFYNVPAQDICRRLDFFMDQNPGKFDIVQHLGLFYHLADPLISLEQCAKIMNPGGTLLFETAMYKKGDKPMALFNSRSDIYHDLTTFWAFNKQALFDSLRMFGFEPDEAGAVETYHSEDVSRIALTSVFK